MRTIYGLKVRADDNSPWSETEWYKSKVARDRVAALNRAIGGFRTYSFTERKSVEEIENLFKTA